MGSNSAGTFGLWRIHSRNFLWRCDTLDIIPASEKLNFPQAVYSLYSEEAAGRWQPCVFLCLCKRHRFNKVPGAHLNSDAGYAVLPLTLLGAPDSTVLVPAQDRMYPLASSWPQGTCGAAGRSLPFSCACCSGSGAPALAEYETRTVFQSTRTSASRKFSSSSRAERTRSRGKTLIPACTTKDAAGKAAGASRQDETHRPSWLLSDSQLVRCS